MTSTGEQNREYSVIDATFAMFRGVIDSSTDMIAVQNLEFCYLAFNKTYKIEFQKLFGVELHVKDCLPRLLAHLPEELAKGKEIWGRTLRGEDFTITREFGDKHLERKSFEIHCHPIRDSEGRVIAAIHVGIDITARRRAEDALHVSQEINRRIIDSSLDGIKVLDLEGRVLSINPSGRRLMEIEDINLILNTPFQNFWPDEGRPLAIQALDDARAGGVGRFQAGCPTAKGKPKWWDVTISPIKEVSGAPERLLVMTRDITEQKKVEDALRDSEERFRRLIETSNVGLAIADAAGILKYANPAVLKLLGYDLDDVRHLHCIEFIAPEFLAQHQHAIQQVLETGVSEPFEKELIAKDGRRVPVISGASLISRDPDGGPITAFSIIDIRARKKAELELQKQNERLMLLSDAAAHLLKAENPETMVLELFNMVSRRLDIQGYMNFMLNEAGDALRLESYAGVPPEIADQVHRLEFGEGVCGTVAMKRQPIYACNIQQSEAEMTLLLKVAGIRAYACNPLMAGDRLLGTLAFATINRDRFSEEDLAFMRTICQYVAMMKERLRLENELRENNQRLAEADRRKDDFLAMLAHELRNPLAPIRNAVQVMRLIGKTTDPALMRQRDIVDRQVTHMARLLDDLLDVSRITRGKIQFKMSPLTLADVVAHAVEMIAPMIEGRHQTLNVSLPVEDLRITGDLDRLAQAICNLLTNASKYTNEGGEIWIDACAENGQAMVQVRDNGIGIEPEMLPRIFELFAQADQGLAHSQGGLGIGLTLVRSLVLIHGGSIEAHSGGIGQGSAFTIRLPLRLTEEKRPSFSENSESQAV